MQDPSPQVVERRSPFEGFLPFFWLAIAAVSGTIFADLIMLPAGLWLAGSALTLLALLLAWQLPMSLAITHILRQWTGFHKKLPTAILFCVGLFAGWRFASAQTMVTPQDLAYYNDRGVVEVVGTIVRPPDDRDMHTNLVMDVDRLTLFGSGQGSTDVQAVRGKLLLRVPPGNEWAYGNRIRVTGVLETPPEYADFSYRVFLARQGINSIMPYTRVDWVEFTQANPMLGWIFGLRTKAFYTLHTIFPSPEADLLAGILLGIEQGLSPGLQEDFRLTGTTHIIAISGFNIAIIAGLFSGILTRLLGRKWGAITAIIGITGYTILVGGDAAVVRAAIMGGLGTIGGMFGRRQNGLNSVGLAVLGMVLINPNIPWDISFQLSVSATLGLVLYAQPLEERFVKTAQRWLTEEQAQKIGGPFSQIFLFTLAAQVMTLPIMAYHFGGISWAALIANPLILPVQALVLILGGLAMIAGIILPGFGHLLAVPALPFVRYTIRMVSWISTIPGADIVLPDFHMLWLVLFYVLLFIITLMPPMQQKAIQERIFSHQTMLIFLAGVVIFIWNLALTQPDGNLHLTLLDEFGTVLIQTPSGNAVLIGGGSRPSHLKQSLGEMLPAGRRKVDLMIIASTNRDDLIGLAGPLKTHHVETAWWGVDIEANQSTRTVYALLNAKGVPIQSMESGQSYHLDEDITLSLLWQGDRGAVFWLTWQNFSALLPTGRVDENWLIAPSMPSIILLPQNIDRLTNDFSKIKIWQTKAILLPLKKADLPLQGEHPVLAEFSGHPLLSTHRHGWIRISTDGEQIWVSAQKLASYH